MIKVESGEKDIVVKFAYNPDYIAKIKTIKGYKWNSEEKSWCFPSNDGIIEKTGLPLKLTSLLRSVPRCTLLPLVVGTHNKEYARNGSARHFSKFFFRYATEKLRISLTLSLTLSERTESVPYR